MRAPKVAVLMTVYNGEKYLRQAIESVLHQTFEDFELLIVDDCSTDSSPAIISSYQDDRIKSVRNSTNRGVACSRKKALELARAQYVAVLDADDVACEHRLQLQVAYLDTHPEIHLVGSAYEVINETGDLERVCHVPADPLTIRWKLLFGNAIAHSSVMFRRQFALSIDGYDERVFAGEDFDLWVRFASHGKIAQLDQPLVQWRRHRHSLQYVEPPQIKDHFIWIVVKSIRLQTGQDVSFEVAKCLFRDIPRPCNSGEVISAAYVIIQNCLDHFLSQPLAETDRRNLVLLALEDVLRIAKQNPCSRRHAWRIAWQYVAGLDGRSLLSKRFMKLALNALLPFRATSLLTRWRSW